MNKIIYILIFIAFAGTLALANVSITPNRAHADVICADCHFTDAPDHRAPDKGCIACHEVYQGETLVVMDSGFEREVNPHSSHYGNTKDMRCTSCHSIHAASRLSCNNCHMMDLQVK